MSWKTASLESEYAESVGKTSYAAPVVRVIIFAGVVGLGSKVRKDCVMRKVPRMLRV